MTDDPSAPLLPAVSMFDELGGEVVLRMIIDRFVDRAFDDPMIGFFFAKANRLRVKQKEYELAARHLGAPVAYTGRPLDVAHAAHPIMGGHFMRRYELLRQTLMDFAVPESIVAHWLEHTQELRPLVTRDPDGRCTDPLSSKRERSDDVTLERLRKSGGS
jgi:hemoglobin